MSISNAMQCTATRHAAGAKKAVGPGIRSGDIGCLPTPKPADGLVAAKEIRNGSQAYIGPTIRPCPRSWPLAFSSLLLSSCHRQLALCCAVLWLDSNSTDTYNALEKNHSSSLGTLTGALDRLLLLPTGSLKGPRGAATGTDCAGTPYSQRAPHPH